MLFFDVIEADLTFGGVDSEVLDISDGFFVENVVLVEKFVGTVVISLQKTVFVPFVLIQQHSQHRLKSHINMLT